MNIFFHGGTLWASRDEWDLGTPLENRELGCSLYIVVFRGEKSSALSGPGPAFLTFFFKSHALHWKVLRKRKPARD